MRRWFASAVILAGLSIVSRANAAPGVNLRWDRCHGDGGVQNRDFACDTNAGAEVLVVSFVPVDAMTLVSGNEIVIDLLSQDDPLPPWWDMKDVGTCRPTSLGFNVTANANDVVCVDWAQGQSSGGIGSYNTAGNVGPPLTSRHRRLKLAVAVPLAGLADLAPETEYFSCNVTINHAKTVGTGACTGCSSPVCMVLNSLKITTNTAGGSGDRTLGEPTVAGSNLVTWQGTGPDCQLVPTKNATWGQVKALYR